MRDPGGPNPYLDRIRTVGVAASATPSRGRNSWVAGKERQEREWHTDHAAYRRLRADGLQPKRLDGSARLEAHADHALEVEQSTLLADVKGAA